MASHPDLDGLPSDAFDTDFDLEGPQSEANNRAAQRANEEARAMDLDESGSENEFDDPELDDFEGFDEFEGPEYITDDEEDQNEEEDEYEDDEGGFEESGEYDLGVDEPEHHAWARARFPYDDEGLLWDDEDDDFDFDPDAENFHRNLRNFSASLEEVLDQFRRRHVNAVDFIDNLHEEVRRDHGLHLLDDLEAHRRAEAALARENQRANARQQQRRQNMPPRQGSRQGDRRAYDLFGDELVEVDVQPVRAAARNLTLPRVQQQQPEVIDLTADSDHDEPQIVEGPRPGGAAPAQAPGRNPRRQPAGIQRTPSLARSDGSILGNPANVIDLTLDDSPDAPPQPIQLPRRESHPLHNNNNRHQPRRSQRVQNHNPRNRHDQPAGFGARLAGFANILSGFDLVRQLGFGRHPDLEIQFLGGLGDNANMENPLANNVPNLNYRGYGPPAPAPKPRHVPPPPPRAGFTRDTGSADQVVVCAGCDQELKYDPEAGQAGSNTPRVKRQRNRKDFEEHHFWAVKECGHVYCKECYDGRKNTSKTPSFRRENGSGNARKIFCAVDGCTSDVNNKGNWVGLFV
ncbi:hypothetical protein VTJ49DRAFT_2277 [Mycothermus thermophilus]|uniref:Cell cycle control protein n=1 Tax=Humicola insolens TaxID=85995 RepID=A0ABR3VAY0_HUMIN